MDLRTKIFSTAALVFAGLGLLLIVEAQSIGKLRYIACDVGQGDGQLIITPSGQEILVDGGPNSKILDCLSAKMPFWDRKIELVVLTHPQQDHLAGLLDVIEKYDIDTLMTTGVGNESDTFKRWEELVNKKRLKIYRPKAGDELVIDDKTRLKILWPGEGQAEEWKVKAPSDLNETVVVFKLVYGDFCAYLTGDITKEILETVIDGKCAVLKVSHHGSKTGTSDAILEKAKPEVAIIQVGKNNRFGHPHKEVLDLLGSKGIKILRNDTDGAIEIDTDGKSLNLTH